MDEGRGARTGGGWAEAQDWTRRMDRIEALLDEASEAGRETAIVSLNDLPSDGALPFRAADAWSSQLPGFHPEPWAPNTETVSEWAALLDGEFDTFWLSDGLEHDWRDTLLAALQARGTVTAFESARPVWGLRPSRAARCFTANVPKPTSDTWSPLARVSVMLSTTASRARPAEALGRSAAAAIASISSVLFTLVPLESLILRYETGPI